MRSLLDVNVLLALLDVEHSSHRRIFDWLPTAMEDGWASCAITENGFVRIMSQPNYSNPVTSAQATVRLMGARNTQYHAFWACDVSLCDAAVVEHSRLLGPKQLTDIYLLALAVGHGGRFVTLDRRIDIATVSGATAENLVVL